MMAEFAGTYKFVKEDGNFDKFLKELNVNYILRKVATTVIPNIEISVEEDGTIVLKTISAFRSSEIRFRLDEEFDEKRMDGTVVKTIIVKEGNKLIQKQNSDKETPVKVEREFIDNRLIATCYVKHIVCVREYVKV